MKEITLNVKTKVVRKVIVKLEKKQKLDQKLLKKFLDYDPRTGLFTWKVNKSFRVKIGDIAGAFLKSNGHVYRNISIHYKLCRCSVLAWLYMYGSYPNGRLGYKNGVTVDDRISNLYEKNSYADGGYKDTINSSKKIGRMFKNNTTGIPGVHINPDYLKHKSKQKYRTSVRIDNKRVCKLFYTKLEAINFRKTVYK